MNTAKNNSQKTVSGVWYAVAAFSAWGVLLVYWKLLHRVPAVEILAHRILWSFIFVSLLVTFSRGWGNVKGALATPKNCLVFLGASILITANWGIYIWAVNAGHIVDASLGYYINPLLSVTLGIVFLRERLNFWQISSLVLALAGVAFLTVEYGKIPWIALSLALTFGFYGLMKKIAAAPSITGLTLETAAVTPLALGYLLWQHLNGSGSFGVGSIQETLLLMGAGIITATPLLWFAKANNRVPLSTVGFTQYLTPTFSLILGVFVYQEQFTRVETCSFGLIWLALLIYSFSQTSFMQGLQPKRFRA